MKPAEALDELIDLELTIRKLQARAEELRGIVLGKPASTQKKMSVAARQAIADAEEKPKKRPGGDRLTPEGRKKLSAATKRNWAAAKRAGVKFGEVTARGNLEAGRKLKAERAERFKREHAAMLKNLLHAKPKKPQTPAQLASRLANVEKARAALAERRQAQA